MRAYQDAQGEQEDDEIETIHVYMLREPLPEEEQQPPQPRKQTQGQQPAASEQESRWTNIVQRIVGSLAMLLLSAFCLIPESPVLVTRTVSVPAILLPLTILQTSVPITPTGVTTIPATRAHGILTIYNGSILEEALPAGFIVTSRNGVEAVTDQAVTIPAAQLPTAGVATVAAHAVVAGVAGNVSAGEINQADGSSLIVKNLAAFSGGQDSSTRRYVTAQDIQNAVVTARDQLAAQKPVGLLPKSCTESQEQSGSTLTLFWGCQYVTYKIPPGVMPIGVRVQGNHVILTYRCHPNT